MSAPEAVVRERGYSGYDGPRVVDRLWLVLAAHTASTLVNRKATRRALGLAFLAAIIAGVVIYVERRVGGAATGAEYPLRLLTKPFGVTLPALFVALAAAGGTLAEDRRAGALSFYFARPLSPRDYLLGRLGGVTAVVALTVAAPTTAVALYRALLCDHAGEALRALGIAAVVLALGLAVSVLVSIYALLGGAVAGSRGGAQGFAGGVFLLPWVLAGVGANVLDGPWASLLSIPHLVESVGTPLVAVIAGRQRSLPEIVFDVRVERAASSDPHLPALIALLGLLALAALGFWVLRGRIEQLGRAGGDVGGGA